MKAPQDHDPEADAFDHAILMADAKKAEQEKALHWHFTCEVHNDTEDCEICPSWLQVDIGIDQLNRLRELRDAVEELDAHVIEVFNYTGKWYDWSDSEDDDEMGAEARTTRDRLVVSATEFWWEAYIKHTDRSFASEPISLDGRSPYRKFNCGRSIPPEENHWKQS